MTIDHGRDLRSIRTFPSLIRYLRDELDWPITSDDFEDITFDYSADELGIDADNAAKIQEIKRLRSLTVDQPWGVFFVKFEPKRLPVVALRRILSRVAIKKRASANSSERAAWQADDLLFISNYGEGEGRTITFAHFSQDEQKRDLPVLKVLGWDNRDTPLHLDHVADVLSERLCWPADESDSDAWRSDWSSAFTLRHREVVSTSKALAVKLAQLAQGIRDRIINVLAIESENGPLTQLMGAFQEALIRDLDDANFADMYAQTVAYGLLSARVARPAGSTADDLVDSVPSTTPFLKELLETFLHVGGRKETAGSRLDFDELGLSEVVDLLDSTNMEAVVRDFGDKNPLEDPVIHFYELFLKEYDSERRMKRGVFYTPRPVVSFIVRAVDSYLRTNLGIDDGLADTITWGELSSTGISIPDSASPRDAVVQILDPATGTGTFLVEAIDLIHETMTEKWAASGIGASEILKLWNKYVPASLLPRLHGYEIMMAPYAIAHLKIGLKLLETGYRFESDERARVYLTNALEPADDLDQRLENVLPALAHEAWAVNQVKKSSLFTVVFGNPPYSDASQNLGPQFAPLIEPFRHFRGERIRERGAIRFEHAINNDYVKFWGLGCQKLTGSPVGVTCMITSSSFLAGKSFRGVRDAMLRFCTSVDVIDLHGEGWAGGLAQAGIEDQNVFEIQTGVAVTLLGKVDPSSVSDAEVDYGELVGTYDEKAAALLGSDAIPCSPVILNERSYLSFVPSAGEEHDEYWEFPQLDTLFIESVDGIKTSRDGLVVSNTRAECVDKLKRFSTLDGAAARAEFRLGARFDADSAQELVSKSFDAEKVWPFAYRPFDNRYIYYERDLIVSHRMNVMPRVVPDGAEAIVCASRLSSRGFTHALGSKGLCAHKFSSHDINSRMFPSVIEVSDLAGTSLRSNFKDGVIDQVLPGADDSVESARRVGHYLLALLNAPSYRERYLEEIHQDFPRLPLRAPEPLVDELTDLGMKLMQAHAVEVPVPVDDFTAVGPLRGIVTSPRFRNDQLWIGPETYIDGVATQVWEYRIAGYQPCKSWFTAGGRSGVARVGSSLSADLVADLRRVLCAVSTTIGLQRLVDEAIEDYGGWPQAFLAPSKNDRGRGEKESLLAVEQGVLET